MMRDQPTGGHIFNMDGAGAPWGMLQRCNATAPHLQCCNATMPVRNNASAPQRRRRRAAAPSPSAVAKPVLTCQPALPPHGPGADGNPTPRFAAYGATKRGLAQLGKSLRVRAGEDGPAAPAAPLAAAAAAAAAWCHTLQRCLLAAA